VDKGAEVGEVVLVGGKMENAVDALQRSAEVLPVRDIAPYELRIARNPGWLAMRVDSLLKII